MYLILHYLKRYNTYVFFNILAILGFAAAELGIPQATARQWARAYAVGGADAVLNADSHHHTYSYEVKLAVVKDRLENGLTVREAMIKHKIPSESSVKAWCRQYRESGESALVDKPRGRKPRVKKAE